MRWGIIAALVLGYGVGLAEEPAADAPKEADPVQEKIEAASQRYYEAIEKIEKDLCRQIDAMVENSANRGDLEIVLELQNQKKQFLESGYPPAAPVFASNRRRAQIEITKAINRMDRAYSDVVAQLTRQRDFTSATRMRDEWKEILATINPEIGDGFEAIRQAKLQKAGLAERTTEKAPVAQQTEAASTDQIIPDFLKDFSNKELTPIQDRFVRDITFLTDGIAHALSNVTGRVYFEKLKKINGSHLKIILSKPNGPFALNFECPTEIKRDFVDALEQLLLDAPQKQIVISIRESTLEPDDFEKLLIISSWGKKDSSLHFDMPFSTLTETHRKIYREILDAQPKWRRHRTISLRSKDYFYGHKSIVQMGPYSVTDIVGKNGVLTSAEIPSLENLVSVVVFNQFTQCSNDMLPILKERGLKNLPTIFLNIDAPASNICKELEKSLVYFLKDTDQARRNEIIREFRSNLEESATD